MQNVVERTVWSEWSLPDRSFAHTPFFVVVASHAFVGSDEIGVALAFELFKRQSRLYALANDCHPLLIVFSLCSSFGKIHSIHLCRASHP